LEERIQYLAHLPNVIVGGAPAANRVELIEKIHAAGRRDLVEDQT
jgi:hypothetical protein